MVAHFMVIQCRRGGRVGSNGACMHVCFFVVYLWAISIPFAFLSLILSLFTLNTVPNKFNVKC